MNTKEDAINLHRTLKGKIEIHNRVSIEPAFGEEKGALPLIYTPGVAYVAEEISKNNELVYDYTSKWNNVALVCDGTRVLGLGNIGPEGALPVMEGKSVLFKVLGVINAIPLCISTTDKEEIIKFVKAIEPGFGAINIEDIESPKVFEIIKRLHDELSIPLFHDDQHGTAVIALAALINSLRLVEKSFDNVKVVICGAGSAGYGIFKILQEAGCKDIVVTDSRGAIYQGREDLENTDTDNSYKQEIASNSNPRKLIGDLHEVIREADVFIGVSGKPGLLSKDMVRSMHSNAIVFALTNPDPEILPSDAVKGGAQIVCTGRSDFPNQVNNAVVFPSVLRALLDTRAKGLNEQMLVTASYAIASLVEDTHLKEDYIIPKVNDPRILPIVTETLKKAIRNHSLMGVAKNKN
ncbi:MAG TPA: NADP-dependent malic enzyme [Candidatus Nitrosopolaris sp.]|nr:NADP-dependent malic enzyme [Candidatus Nitrosopolaris sp.]